MSKSALFEKFLAIHSRIRERFPQIDYDIRGNPRIHINCAAGSLVVDTASRCLAEAARDMNPQPGDIYPAEIATSDFQQEVREIIADFLNARSSKEITFHLSTSHALFSLAYALRSILTSQNNLIVTDLDHMSNVSPWETVWGKERGAEVRRCRLADNGSLDIEHLLSLVDKNTGFVSLTMASNATGEIVPLKTLTAMIKGKNPACLVCVDAVHYALHGPIDIQDLDCDFLAFSGYKVFGPMAGVLWGRADLLERLEPYRVETNKNEAPWKFELGTLNNAVLASLKAALEYLLWVGGSLPEEAPAAPDRRAQFKFAMSAIAGYEAEISRVVLEGLSRFIPDNLHLFGDPDPGRCFSRVPTFSLEAKGLSASELKTLLWKASGIQVADGNHYSAVFFRHFGINSVCRASFAHYNSLREAEVFVETLNSLVSSP